MKFGIRRPGKIAWAKQKEKAAVFLKLAERMGAKQIVRLHMRRAWYRHIDKAVAGKATNRDARHWRKMSRVFKREIVGEPTEETRALLEWLEGFWPRVKREEISKGDQTEWLPRFRAYMESCEENSIDNYIIKNKMMEA